MMNFILFILFLCSSTLMQCSDASAPLALEEPITTPLPFASNGLFIFLDQDFETSDKVEVIGHALLTALDQKAGPILTSPLLLRDIIKQPAAQQIVDKAKNAKDPNAQLYQAFVTYRQNIHNYLSKISSDSPQAEIEQDLNSFSLPKETLAQYEKVPQDLVNAIDAELYYFSPSSGEWIIKKVNAHLLLLIPVKYVEDIKKKTNFAQYYKSSKFSENELNLGIKLDSLENINFDNFINNYTPPANRDPGSFFVDSLSNIFITRAEYALDSKEKVSSFHMPQWAFYLIGHGLSGTVIADIAIDSFKKMLDFFDTKIVTKLLVYNSCYAAGVSAQVAYKDTKFSGFKAHSFTIVTAALTDIPVKLEQSTQLAGISYWQIDFDKKREKPINAVYYNKFLKKITEENTPNFGDILVTIFPEALSRQSQYILDVPQIKLPGVEWFNIIDVGKKVVSIGQTLATSRSANQPLDIIKFFARGYWTAPVAILIYANIIPFELIISTPKVPTLVPMIPGNSYTEIAQITVNNSLKDFFDAMNPLKITYAFYQKVFLIKKLRVTGISQNGEGTTEFNNVFVKILLGNIYIYVADKENNYFKWDFKANKLVATNDYTGEFKNIAEQEKERLEKAQEKMRAAERIRKIQEGKIRTIEEERQALEAQAELDRM